MLPKNLFRVTIKGADRMMYGERGGGTFSTERTANDRANGLRKRHPEAEIKTYITECDWQEL